MVKRVDVKYEAYKVTGLVSELSFHCTQLPSADMGQCLGRSLTPRLHWRDIFKRVRCICTCCGGRVSIFQSELDGKQQEKPTKENLLQPQAPS